jgi:putative transposase
VLIEAWRREYNSIRPHSSLGNLTPVESAKRCSTTQQIEVIL